MANVNELNGTYVIDPAHSQIGFVTRHAMVTKVRGAFDEFEGKATTGANLENAQIDVTIKVDSVNTRQAMRDGHLKTGDFFDAEQFPTITFRSTSIQAKGDDVLAVSGDLTIKGTAKPVTIDFTYAGTAKDHQGNMRAGFEGKTVINRSDFGLSFNAPLETGGVLISEKIELELEISAIQQA